MGLSASDLVSGEMSDSGGGPTQVDDPNYRGVNHTAAQSCGWRKNALRGEGKCYKNIFQ
jgi:tRNA wybutosine-synthesizing protein 1